MAIATAARHGPAGAVTSMRGWTTLPVAHTPDAGQFGASEVRELSRMVCRARSDEPI
jgi:hypothetical protein